MTDKINSIDLILFTPIKFINIPNIYIYIYFKNKLLKFFFCIY